jgi:HEAT repeat protein
VLTCRRIAIWLLGVCSAAFIASGCNLVAEPAADLFDNVAAANAGSSRAAEIEQTLADAEWVVAPTAAATDESNAAARRGRWRHAGLEAVLSRDDARDRLRHAVRSTDAAVSATAAIGLAWLGEPQVLKRLEQAARDTSLKLPARGAAIEAIGRLDSTQPDDVLTQLFEEYGQFRGAGRPRYVPELHADLARAVAHRDGDRHAEAIRNALQSPAAPVRMEATRAYLIGRHSPPRELIDRAADDVASVRAVAIQALAQTQHAEAQACVLRALSDYDLTVRLAAIEALGVLPAAENAARLNELRESSTDVIRAAAVKALAARGDVGAVVGAVEDKSWRVRSAVAESLLKLSYTKREPLARALVGDASLEVQRRLVRALADWPLDEAIPLLLTAIEGRTAATRRDATEQLQARWPAAAELSPHASREALAAESARLREVWQQDYGAEVARRMAMPSEVAATSDAHAVAAIIERLATKSSHERRAAARELALKYRETRLPEEALERLRELVEAETDALVWNDVLLFIGHDGRAAAADLAAIAASHPAGDVRRRACSYFGEHPSSRAAHVLLNSLADEDANVVREAVRSLGNQGVVPDLAPLEALLTSTDSLVRLEAAAALSRLGSPEGVPALLRLTHHQDPLVRRQSATALGAALNQPQPRQPINDAQRREAIAELTRLLNDKADVRRAAGAILQEIGSGTRQ